MTSLETSYTKNVANKLSFLLVTDTTRFDVRFGLYGALNFCFSSEQVMDRLDHRRLVRFWRTLSQLSNAYSNTHFK
jgi:hypothetical protein